MSERGEFEAWADHQGWTLQRGPHGNYAVSFIESQWEAWQARSKKERDLVEALEEALPYVEAICEAGPVGGPDDNCSVNRAETVRDSIYSAFLKRHRRTQKGNDL